MFRFSSFFSKICTKEYLSQPIEKSFLLFQEFVGSFALKYIIGPITAELVTIGDVQRELFLCIPKMLVGT